MISSKKEDQEELFNFIKSMYKKRGKLVHGDQVDISDDEILKLENILRVSIKKYLNSKNSFSEKSLNSIFFN